MEANKLKSVIYKVFLTINLLWQLSFFGICGYSVSEYFHIKNTIESRGLPYKVAFDKLVVNENWNDLTEEETHSIFKYFNSNFNYNFKTITIEDVKSVELDYHFFFGRYIYPNPFIFWICLISIGFAPMVLFVSLKFWVVWLFK